MGMLLKHHIIIMAVTDIEFHIRLLHMLLQEPSAVGNHGHFALDPLFLQFCRSQGGHIVIVSMAVSDKQDS